MVDAQPSLDANTGKHFTTSHLVALILGSAACGFLFFLDKLAPTPPVGPTANHARQTPNDAATLPGAVQPHEMPRDEDVTTVATSTMPPTAGPANGSLAD